MNIDLIRKQLKEKKKSPIIKNNVTSSIKNIPKWQTYLIKVMVLLVLFLGVLIYTKASPVNKQSFYDFVFKNNLSFATINNLYNKYLGGILPFKNIIKNNKPVFNEKLEYEASSIYKEGVALTVKDSYPVPILAGGIVIFVGDKEDYGKTVIIQQVDGVDVWYGNVDNLNVSIYDYVEEGTLLGETIDNKLYLVFKKEGNVVDYKEYLQ